jgi:hypothetical protein
VHRGGDHVWQCCGQPFQNRNRCILRRAWPTPRCSLPRARRISGRGDQQAHWWCVVVAGLVPLTPAGTGIELEVLFDAALNGGRLDWTDVIPKLDGKGPLLVLARTDKGFMSIHNGKITDRRQQRVWRIPGASL